MTTSYQRLRRSRASRMAAAAFALAGCQTDARDVASQTPAPSPIAALPGHADTSEWITLITGDRVRVTSLPNGARGVEVRAGTTRRDMQFRTLTSLRHGRTEVLVVPADAAPLLAAGKLDRRLFDVGLLAERGLADRHGRKLPLIVHRTNTGPLHRARTRGVLHSIGAEAVELEREHVAEFWATLTAGTAPLRKLSQGVEKVWLDGLAQPALAESVAQIGGDVAFEAGFTGAGVTVAVLDTGLAEHPDLAGRVEEAVDFTDTLPDAGDDVGHGTHCAGILAGSGSASSGQYRGVAPEATLLIGRVCTSEGCPESAIIAGMEWAAPRARIVNMSLGGEPTDGTDPLSSAIDVLSAEHGTLFVVAAGNDGPPGSVSTPSVANAALSIASVTKEDLLSSFSNTGPRFGDFALKPDLAAPGDGIAAARAAGTFLGDLEPVADFYARLSGTSMATPHVAGAAALLAQAHPDWDGSELKAVLMGSAAAIDSGVVEAGTGRLDVARALTQTVHLESGSVSFPFSRFPHVEPATRRTLTYHNTGDTPRDLHLSLELTGPDGSDVPDGMFTLAREQLTLAPGARASVDLTVDTSALANSLVHGMFAGHLTASAEDGTRVRSSVGVYLEEESYELTVQTHTRGVPNSLWALVFDPKEGSFPKDILLDAEGRGSVRLPKGSYYAVLSEFSDDAAGGRISALAVEPEVEIVADTSLELDTRRGVPLALKIDRPAFSTELISHGFAIGEQGFEMSTMKAYPTTPEPSAYVTPIRPRHPQDFVFKVQAVLTDRARPEDEERFAYALSSRHPREIPQEPSLRFRESQLARVDTRYFAQGVAGNGLASNCPIHDGDQIVFCSGYQQTFPGRRVEYFVPASDLTWAHQRWAAEDIGQNTEQIAKYEPGRSSRTFNRAPLAPALDERRGGVAHVLGEGLGVSLGLFSPSEPGQSTVQRNTETTGTLSLRREGVLLGTSDSPETGRFPEAGEPGVYELTAEATRTVPWTTLGTFVKAAWRFPVRGTGSMDTPEVLPLLTVRSTARVDDYGRAPAGVPYLLTLEAEHQTGSMAAPIRALSLEVSHDDGASFQRVPLERVGNRAVAFLRHPSRSGFASLRVNVRDANGSALTQTMLRAYPFGAPEKR